eukprot:150151_1
MSLEDRIGEFYDATSEAWVSVWGNHCHHGYFDSITSTKTPYEAQVHLIELLLAFGGIDDKGKKKILDTGCGVGGSTKYLSEKYKNSDVTGINISNKQLEIANKISKTNNNQFLKRNAMNTEFDENTFDFVWSCEMAEHIPDHYQFLNENYRILKPNGTFLCATWCCKTESKLTMIDNFVLRMVDKYFNSSLTWISPDTYQKHFDKIGYKHVKKDDWTGNVSIFWIHVLKSILTRKGLYEMFCKGNSHLWLSMISVVFMWIGFVMGTIRFAVFTAKKRK